MDNKCVLTALFSYFFAIDWIMYHNFWKKVPLVQAYLHITIEIRHCVLIFESLLYIYDMKRKKILAPQCNSNSMNQLAGGNFGSHNANLIRVRLWESFSWILSRETSQKEEHKDLESCLCTMVTIVHFRIVSRENSCVQPRSMACRKRDGMGAPVHRYE